MKKIMLTILKGMFMANTNACEAHAFATSKCGGGTFLPKGGVGGFLSFLLILSETRLRFATDEISPEDEGYLILSKSVQILSTN